jgi:signal transduction histidine kinase
VIGRVAHDLRATLNAVAGWGGVLEAAGPLSAEDVRRAGAAVSRQARLTSRRLDLALDFWRLDVGLIDLTPAPTPAASMAQGAVATCASVSVERGVACDVTADATVLVSVHGAGRRPHRDRRVEGRRGGAIRAGADRRIAAPCGDDVAVHPQPGGGPD